MKLRSRGARLAFTFRPWLLAALALALMAPLAAAESGSFGFRLNVKLGGPNGTSIFSFRIGSAVVQSVTPGSPAANALVAAGDELIEVDGLVVPGGKGLQLKARLKPEAGKKVPMKFKRANGEIYRVILAPAALKPALKPDS